MAEPRPVDLFIMSNERGEGTMTLGRPIYAPVDGMKRCEVWVPVGDPLGIRHLCAEMLEILLGERLPPGEAVRYQLSARRKQERADRDEE